MPKPKTPTRHRDFRVIARSKKDQLLRLQCFSCGHEFSVKEFPENHYFRCQNFPCGAEGNLQDVLVLETELIPTRKDNPEFGITDEKRKELIDELLQLHPHPKKEG